MPRTNLSIVVPVYNEARNIEPLLNRLAAALHGVDWEVIFVDDNSPDGTAEVVREAAFRDDRVRLVLRIKDRGLAKACLQGLLTGKADRLCVMDGDGQHDPAVIHDLLAPLERNEADVVSAARRFDNAPVAGSLSAKRVALSRLGNALSRILLGRDVSDPLTGFFAIQRAALLRVAPKLSDAGFKILFDILMSGPSLRHREVPFTFGARAHGHSKLDMATLWEFASFVLSKLTKGLVPPRLVSFLLVGGTGVFVHFAVLFLLMALNVSFDVAQAGAATVAIVSNYLLNNSLTFRDRRLRGQRLALGLVYFLLISSVGLVANVAIASYTYGELKAMAALAALAGIAIDTIWKFAVSSRLVWRPS